MLSFLKMIRNLFFFLRDDFLYLLQIDYSQFKHIPRVERDEFYGIEKGYENCIDLLNCRLELVIFITYFHFLLTLGNYRIYLLVYITTSEVLMV